MEETINVLSVDKPLADVYLIDVNGKSATPHFTRPH